MQDKRELSSNLISTSREGYNHDELAEMRNSDKVRILLADDHAVVREGTRRIIDAEPDMEVVAEAGDGQETIRLANVLQPDVVVLDIAMPRVNGVKATQEIKATSPSIAVLILSAYDDDAYLFSVLEAGAAGYLLKNCKGSELVDAIRAIRRGESVLHPVVAAKVLKRLTGTTYPANPSIQTHTLTKREVEVLRVAAWGLSNKDIAKTLNLSSRTIQAHLGNIFNKLSVSSRTEAVISALRQGILTIQDVKGTVSASNEAVLARDGQILSGA